VRIASLLRELLAIPQLVNSTGQVDQFFKKLVISLITHGVFIFFLPNFVGTCPVVVASWISSLVRMASFPRELFNFATGQLNWSS
jgi:hypothetical protein